ncbi:alkaline phosphatase-like protein [Violaceomyces palustris]|uniref:Alkaline phosphatase-like protein n=1 Tax=Violaceomyces palustris TaxID=1673888 RepID=A0ACD0P433_9BASI|nr:alkaline phosphatase-like protein [Violaceomyces palustris]
MARSLSSKSEGPLQDPSPLLPQPIATNHGRKRGCLKLKNFVILAVSLVIGWNLVPLVDRASKLAGHVVPLSFYSDRPEKINVIMMVSDGYGPASQTFTRAFGSLLSENPKGEGRLPLDKILVGSHRSRSSSSLITDSAAGATAFSCALKSYNGAIGVDENGKPCGTVFEAAKEKGLLTGVVVTTRLTDATPAAYISHASSRAFEPLIASQLIGGEKNPLHTRILDLAIGGGGCNFLPMGRPYSCRDDEEDTIQEARKLGWDVKVAFPTNTSSDMEDATGANSFFTRMDKGYQANQLPELPFMALLAPGNTPFEIDRMSLPEDERLPSLSQLSSFALESLSKSKDNKNGFIIMIEGSQIDLCAHNNDPACHAREALAYQQAVATVKKFVDEHNKGKERTVMISTSDHETGGVTLGRQLTEGYPNYAYYPDRLLQVKQSTPVLADRILGFARAKLHEEEDPIGSRSDAELAAFIKDEIFSEKGLGLGPKSGGEATSEEIEWVVQAVKDELAASRHLALMSPVGWPKTHYDKVHTEEGPVPPTGMNKVRKTLADITARRAEIGFSTEGHTGVDINVYGHGYGIHDLKGNMENTDIGKFIAKVLDLDLSSVTKKLNKH